MAINIKITAPVFKSKEYGGFERRQTLKSLVISTAFQKDMFC